MLYLDMHLTQKMINLFTHSHSYRPDTLRAEPVRKLKLINLQNSQIKSQKYVAKLVVQTPPTSVLGPTSERKVFVGFFPLRFVFFPPSYLVKFYIKQINQTTLKIAHLVQQSCETECKTILSLPLQKGYRVVSYCLYLLLFTVNMH